jgi:hypothetical protein
MIRLPRSFCLQIGLLASLLVALSLAACSPPVQVERTDLRSAYDELNRTALSSSVMSPAPSCAARLARGIRHPARGCNNRAACPSHHHRHVLAGSLCAVRDELLRRPRSKSKAMMLASALYAYAVLFPTGGADRPSPYSSQFLHAADSTTWR